MNQMPLLSAAAAAIKTGRFAEAEQFCRQALAQDPANPGALDMLGVIAGRVGQHQQAAELMRKAVALQPEVVGFRLNLATALIAIEEYEEAEAVLRHAMQMEEEKSPRLWGLWGTVNTFRSNLDEAIGSFEKSLSMDPRQPSVLFNMGEAHRRMGNADQAITFYRRAIEVRPQYPEALNNLAGMQLFKGDYLDALRSIQAILAIQPRSSQAYLNLGVALRAAGDPMEAIKAYRNALTLDPKTTRALFDLITLYTTMGEFEDAEECIQKLEVIAPDDVRLAVGRARIAERQGDVESARRHIEPAFEAHPLDGNVVLIYANILGENGEPEKAAAALETYLQEQSGDIESLTSVLFSLAKLKDRLKQYPEAFEYLDQANEGRRKGLLTEFSAAACERETDRVIETYSPSRYAELPRATLETERPIFIVGMPRSGTSLAEQILASHPDVHGAGELSDIREIIEATYGGSSDGEEKSGFTIVETDDVSDFHVPANLDGLDVAKVNEMAQEYLDRLNKLDSDAKHVTDKMPYNFHVVGVIKLMFPNAPIIHCRRDAMDTCLSCYFQNFFRGNYQAFHLEHLGHYYRGYERIMRHWQETLGLELLDLQYEDLVSDPETHVRRMLEFCGLSWDDRCLDFHKTKRVIDTASYQQVRQPMYTKSVARWRNYEANLKPLSDVLQYEDSP